MCTGALQGEGLVCMDTLCPLAHRCKEFSNNIVLAPAQLVFTSCSHARSVGKETKPSLMATCVSWKVLPLMSTPAIVSITQPTSSPSSSA